MIQAVIGGFQLEFVNISIWPVIIWVLIGGKIYLKKSPLQDLPSSLNAVISTNESNWIYKGHVIYICGLYLQIPTENHHATSIWINILSLESLTLNIIEVIFGN